MARARWAREWCTEGAVSTPDEAVERDWKRRWERTSAARRAQEGRNTREPAETDPVFRGKQALKRHMGLKKHESSLLTQIRTGKVGLRAFLFQRRVPNVATPLCRCGNGEETPAHIAVFCPELEEERRELRAILAPQALLTTRDFAGATGDPARASAMVKWLLATGRFPEYRLARRYAEIQDREDSTAAPRDLGTAPVRGQ